jgi:hypothetical protein
VAAVTVDAVSVVVGWLSCVALLVCAVSKLAGAVRPRAGLKGSA